MSIFKRASLLTLVAANIAAAGVLLSTPAAVAAGGNYCTGPYCHCYYGGAGGPPGCYDQAAPLNDCHKDGQGNWCANN